MKMSREQIKSWNAANEVHKGKFIAQGASIIQEETVPGSRN